MRFARAFAVALGLLAAMPAAAQERLPVAGDAPEALALVERLRAGGLVLHFRHADTIGMPCDRSFRIGDRAGQRNISPRGRAQAASIGAALSALGIPVGLPVLAGPVYRARDTAELAFGPANVRVTDELLADDYADARVAETIAAHRALFAAPVPAGTNRVLVGHRTPAIMVFGAEVAGRAFPEGASLVIEPGGAQGRVVGIWMPAPLPDAGFHGC
jgi:phosphohistidine phosphatase SixA